MVFFVTYLRRELRRRLRQAVLIALGLALGVGLVITVTAASAGVEDAQADVLQSLYGVGTDVTVTKEPEPPKPGAGTGFKITPEGSQVCKAGKCDDAAGGDTYDNLTSQSYAPQDASSVSAVEKLNGVAAAAGGLSLTNTHITIPGEGAGGGGMPEPESSTVEGVDLSHRDLGPLSGATLSAGRDLKTSDASSNVALVDSNYAAQKGLSKGETVTIAGKKFDVVGIVSQPQGSQPPNVYIPLQRAQALGTAAGKSLAGKVNTIYVSATSAANIDAVEATISDLLPGVDVTTSSSLADQVTGSLASTAKLANQLGKWLSVLVLIAAFAVASLLTMSAVSRRVREFGTLKALGWRSGRIITQVIGESVAVGVLGGALGVGLGFAGAEIISRIAPDLSATVETATGQQMQRMGPGGSQTSDPTVSHTVDVPMSASVTIGAIALALVLAIAGGLLSGAAGSWRIAQLRPASALGRIG